MNWEEFWNIILEGDSPESVLAFSVIMLAGAIVYFGADVARSAKKSDIKFSWGYMVRDNFIRGIVVLIVIVGTVLWYEEFFGTTLNAKLAFSQGIGIDALIGVIAKGQKESGVLKKSRARLVKKYS